MHRYRQGLSATPIVESTASSFELVVPSEEELAARIADRQPTHPWLVVEETGGVAGYAYAGRFAGRAAYIWSVATSVYVAEHARARGPGRALYTTLFAILIAQGYQQAMAGITLPNPARVALHEGIGFEPVGVYRAAGWRFGAWHDVGWWQRTLAVADGAPQTPIPVNALPVDVLDAALAAGGDVAVRDRDLFETPDDPRRMHGWRRRQSSAHSAAGRGARRRRFERDRAAGAEILSEPADQEYGQREYGVADPDGQSWWFATPAASACPRSWGFGSQQSC